MYVDLRTAIINNQDDKVRVSMMKQGSSISTANMFQSLTIGDQGEQGEDEEMKKEVTQEEILAMVRQFRKGPGKGNRKRRAWLNCGERDHCSKVCPNDKQDNSCTDGGTWKNQKGSKAGKDAGKGWDAGRSNWNICTNSKGKGKDWYGNGKSQEWQGQNRQNDWTTPARKGYNNMKGKDASAIYIFIFIFSYSVDEASDTDWWTQSDGSQPSSEEEIHFCMLSESRVQRQRCEVHQEEDAK